MALQDFFSQTGNQLGPYGQEDDARKKAKTALDSAHKFKMAMFDLEYPEPPKQPKMDKGQGMTSILGTLIASLAGGAQGGQNFQQGYMGSIAQQMERQQQDALMRQQWDMQNQRGRLGAEADYQGDMSQYYTGEANRIQGGIEKRQASQEKRELSLDDLAGQAMGGNIRNSRVLELRLGLLKTRGVPIPPELEATMRQGVQAAEAEDKAKADLEAGNKLKTHHVFSAAS